MDEKIRTSSAIKQQYQYLFARHLSHLGLPINHYYIYEFITTCMADDRIRKVLIEELEKLEEDKLGYEKDEILNSLKYFQKEYYQNAFLLDTLKKKKEYQEKEETKNEKVFKKVIFSVIKELSLEVPLINDYLMIVFGMIVKNTDLEYINAPREEILHPDAQFNRESYKENLREIQ